MRQSRSFGVFAGTVSGVTTSVLFAPLDICRVRLQVQRIPIGTKHPGQYGGIYSTCSKMVQKEGVRSLYRGVFPTLISVGPSLFIFLSLYGYFGEKVMTKIRFLEEHPTLKHFCASVCAGSINIVFLQPIFTMKVNQQTRSSFTPISAISKEIYKAGRIKGFYQGTIASFAGLGSVAVQFPIYELLKRKLSERRNGVNKSDNTICELAIASSVSKIISGTVTYPLDVVRSRLQQASGNDSISNNNMKHSSSKGRSKCMRYKSTSHCVKLVYRVEGFRGFFGGMTTNFVKTVPQSIITLLTYEKCKTFRKT